MSENIEVYEFKQRKSKRGAEKPYITARIGDITATAEYKSNRVSGDIVYHIIRNRETLEGLTEYSENGRRKRTKGTKVDPAGDIDKMIKLRDYLDTLR